jgi:hypothetical protein
VAADIQLASVKGLAAPAKRALAAAGFERLEQLVGITEAEISKLHGMGANALKVLRSALETEGLTFKQA